MTAYELSNGRMEEEYEEDASEVMLGLQQEGRSITERIFFVSMKRTRKVGENTESIAVGSYHLERKGDTVEDVVAHWREVLDKEAPWVGATTETRTGTFPIPHSKPKESKKG